jgi:hypothetical protein
MSITKGPTEGGSGGRRGHSNMEHRGYTDEVKLAAKKRRRLESRKLAFDALKESQPSTRRTNEALRAKAPSTKVGASTM